MKVLIILSKLRPLLRISKVRFVMSVPTMCQYPMKDIGRMPTGLSDFVGCIWKIDSLISTSSNVFPQLLTCSFLSLPLIKMQVSLMPLILIDEKNPIIINQRSLFILFIPPLDTLLILYLIYTIELPPLVFFSMENPSVLSPTFNQVTLLLCLYIVSFLY